MMICLTRMGRRLDQAKPHAMDMAAIQAKANNLKAGARHRVLHV